jgi:hypothetical protein
MSAMHELRDRVIRLGAREAIFARARKMATADGIDFHTALGRLGRNGGRRTGAMKKASAPKPPFSETLDQRVSRVGELEKRGLW